jgi:hypothetical protein
MAFAALSGCSIPHRAHNSVAGLLWAPFEQWYKGRLLGIFVGKTIKQDHIQKRSVYTNAILVLDKSVLANRFMK